MLVKANISDLKDLPKMVADSIARHGILDDKFSTPERSKESKSPDKRAKVD